MHHKFLLLAVILIVDGVLVALFWQFQAAPTPELANITGDQQQSSASSQTDDTDPAALNAEIESINIGDLDVEFRSIDADINSL